MGKFVDDAPDIGALSERFAEIDRLGRIAAGAILTIASTKRSPALSAVKTSLVVTVIVSPSSTRPLTSRKCRWPVCGIEALDVVADLVERDVARDAAERALGRHHRIHREPLDLAARERILGEAGNLRFRLGRNSEAGSTSAAPFTCGGRACMSRSSMSWRSRRSRRPSSSCA